MDYAKIADISELKGQAVVARRTVYVYQAPVRIWHWVNAACMTVLFVTGYLIASPPASLGGEASAHFQMGYIRFAHFAAGQTMAVFFLMRFLWTFVGNAASKQLFWAPVWKKNFWDGLWNEAKWYMFMVKFPRQYVGHNPLAHLMMVFVFTLGTVFMICTGFALYSQGAGEDSLWAKLFGWVFAIFPNSQDVHTYHHFGLWVLCIFAAIHVYAAVREDIMSRQSMISSMISGERQFRDDRV
jgi:Ni/Fe-hydrogenase 1 B-type cytochrome subunit